MQPKPAVDGEMAAGSLMVKPAVFHSSISHAPSFPKIAIVHTGNIAIVPQSAGPTNCTKPPSLFASAPRAVQLIGAQVRCKRKSCTKRKPCPECALSDHLDVLAKVPTGALVIYTEYAANAIQGTSQVHKNAVLIEKGKQLYLEEARRRAGAISGLSFTHVPSHCKIPGNERIGPGLTVTAPGANLNLPLSAARAPGTALARRDPRLALRSLRPGRRQVTPPRLLMVVNSAAVWGHGPCTGISFGNMQGRNGRAPPRARTRRVESGTCSTSKYHAPHFLA
jgi:hypothetical protein